MVIIQDMDWMTDERFAGVRRVTPQARRKLPVAEVRRRWQSKLAKATLEAAEFIEANPACTSHDIPEHLAWVTYDPAPNVEGLVMSYGDNIYFQTNNLQWFTIRGATSVYERRKIPMTGELRAWRQIWLMKFGHLEIPEVQMMREQRQKELDKLHAEALETYRREMSRPVDEFLGAKFEDMETRQVAYWWHVAGVLRAWVGNQRMAHAEWIRRGDPMYLLGGLLSEAYYQLEAELKHRTKLQPEKRSSMSKTEKARKDFEKAAGYLEDKEAFFTAAYRNEVIDTVFPVDLSVDFERLPKYRIQDKPVMWLRPDELIDRIEMWMDAESADEFEAEDKQALKQSIAGELGCDADADFWACFRDQLNVKTWEADDINQAVAKKTAFFDGVRQKFARLVGEHSLVS